MAKNIVRGVNPSMSDARTASLSKLMVPVIALAGVAFVFAGGQTLVTLLLLGYALVTQLFPALVLALVRPGWVTKQGAMAGIVAGVGMVAAMSFAGATPETSSTVDSLHRRPAAVPRPAEPGYRRARGQPDRDGRRERGHPRRGAAPPAGRFERAEQAEWSASR